MSGHLEARLVTGHPSRVGKRTFEPGMGRDVAHGAAVPAQEVMVVPGEILRQLEAAVVIRAEDPVHRTGISQDAQVPVRRAQRHRTRLGTLDHLRHGQWSLGGLEDRHDRSTATRVALLQRRESRGDLVVEIDRRAQCSSQ